MVLALDLAPLNIANSVIRTLPHVKHAKVVSLMQMVNVLMHALWDLIEIQLVMISVILALNIAQLVNKLMVLQNV